MEGMVPLQMAGDLIEALLAEEGEAVEELSGLDDKVVDIGHGLLEGDGLHLGVVDLGHQRLHLLRRLLACVNCRT